MIKFMKHSTSRNNEKLIKHGIDLKYPCNILKDNETKLAVYLRKPSSNYMLCLHVAKAHHTWTSSFACSDATLDVSLRLGDVHIPLLSGDSYKYSSFKFQVYEITIKKKLNEN